MTLIFTAGTEAELLNLATRFETVTGSYEVEISIEIRKILVNSFKECVPTNIKINDKLKK